MRQSDPDVVTALTHRPWSLSRFGDGLPRFPSPWKHHWMTLMDIVLDLAHYHFLWKLCGISAFLIQKNFVSQWVSASLTPVATLSRVQVLQKVFEMNMNSESFRDAQSGSYTGYQLYILVLTKSLHQETWPVLDTDVCVCVSVGTMWSTGPTEGWRL